MGKSILSQRQQELLTCLSDLSAVTDSFYLSGGTALAEYYLHHRYSEDLDFFSENEVDSQGVFTTLHSLKQQLGFARIDSEQSFNRNLFFIQYPDGEVIKTEFTYYPFPPIENGLTIGALRVDSLFDIAVNKVFTIFQRPRSRDFIDLYCIVTQQDWQLSDLIKKAQAKFDWYVDPLQLGSQFLQATVLKDFPRLLIDLPDDTWQNFFLGEAERLQNNILE